MFRSTRLVFGGALSGKSVGFVGLGNMGGFMARNILHKHIKADPDTKLYVLDTRAEVGACPLAFPHVHWPIAFARCAIPNLAPRAGGEGHRGHRGDGMLIDP